jgi:hypothetical protein
MARMGGSPPHSTTNSYFIGTASKMAPANEFATNKSFMSQPKVRIRSITEIRLLSLLTGIACFAIALAIQWLIYDRFLLEDGFRLVGSAISGFLAFVLVYMMALRSRRAQLAELHRMQIIALMNHHVRNALQAIVYCSGGSESVNIIQNSVNRIEWVLSEVLPGLQLEDREHIRQ